MQDRTLRTAYRHSQGYHRSIMGRAVWILVVGLTSIAPMALAQLHVTTAGSNENRARRLLALYLHRGQTTPYIAEQTTRTFTGGMAESRQIVKHAGPGRQRIEYLAPNARRGDVILIVGSRMLHYRAQPRPRLFTGDAPADHFATRARDLLISVRKGRVRLDLVGSEEVSGRPAAIVDIHPKGGGAHKRFWIDTEYGVCLKHETINRSGDVLASTKLTRIDYAPRLNDREFNPASLPAAPIEAMVPRSPSVGTIAEAQKQVAFTIRAPSAPDRYTVRGIWIIGEGAKRGVLLRYSDDVNPFTVTLRAAPKLEARTLKDAPPRRRRGITVWTSRGVVYSLIGTLSREVQRSIVDSVD